MISRSANSYPRVVATVRPISLPRLPAVSEIATILMRHLLPENASAPVGGTTAKWGHSHTLHWTPPALHHSPDRPAGPGPGTRPEGQAPGNPRATARTGPAAAATAPAPSPTHTCPRRP